MKTELNISGMSCGHCTAAVEAEIARIPGVRSVKADLKKQNVVVKHDDSVAVAALAEAVAEAGFSVV
jgi:copper ion binding protein